MANTSRIRGLWAVRMLDGSPFTGGVQRFSILAAYGTALFPGDAVVLGGTSDADGVPNIEQGASGADLLGVIQSIEPLGSNLEQLYSPASTAGYAYVITNPNVLFEAEMDGTPAITSVGSNFDIEVAAGDTTRQISGMYIDTSDEATTNTLQFTLVEIVQRADNEVGASAKGLFKPNAFTYGSGRAGV